MVTNIGYSLRDGLTYSLFNNNLNVQYYLRGMCMESADVSVISAFVGILLIHLGKN